MGSRARSPRAGRALLAAARATALGSILFAALGAAAAARAAEAATSFVLVTLDTTRADRIGAYGRAGAETPTLDSLARRGALFERAYAATPVTLPSHATLLTGLYPPHHGVRDNGIHALPEDAETLAEVLAGRGYRTAAFVSAAVLGRRFGLAQGFEVYDDDLAGGRPKEPRMVAERGADITVDAARRWLDGLDDGDAFFLWVHLFDPHAPYAPPPPFAARFAQRPYDGEISFADAEIGRLLAHPRLTRAAGGDRLLVMAVGDHGESLGEHGEASHGMLAYEATLRVPWIVAGAGVELGIRVAEAVSQADLVPTAIDLLGASAEPAAIVLDGESVAGRLRGGAVAAGARRALYAETLAPYFAYGWAALRSLVVGRLKLIEGPAPELYDVVADPAESRNLHGAQPDEAATLTRDLAARFGPGDAAPRESRAAPDAAADAALRSLGYVGGRGAPAPARARRDPKTMMEVHHAVERAQAHLYARDLERALRELRAVLERDPDNLAALEDTALALGEQGRFDGAVRALERALALAPSSARLHLVRAQLAGARGDWSAALAGADAALALAPDEPGAVAVRAEALFRLGRREEAAAVLRRGLVSSPGEPLLEVRYAELADLPAGRLEQAETRLRRAAIRQPHLAAAWLALGRTLAAAGRHAEARDAYAAGLAWQPRDASLHAALGLLLVDFDPPEAPAHLELAVELSASPALDVLNALADLREGAGEQAAAAALRARVLARPALSAEDRHQRAMALRALGRGEEAAAEWRALVASTPEHAPAWQGLAATALDREAWSDAAAAARRAVEIDPELATAWNTLAIAIEKSEGGPAAVELYRRAVEADPGYWQASLNLGLLLRDLGRFEQAVEALEQVVSAVPDHAKAHYELGLLYSDSLDDPTRALPYLETALRLDPASPRAQAARRALARLRAR